MTGPEYTVTIYITPLPVPLNLWVHAYLVCSDGKTTERFDVIGYLSAKHPTAIDKHLYRNLLPTEAGFFILPGLPTFGVGPRWRSKVHATISGTTNSPAHQLHSFITNGGLLNYPYASEYKMIRGPNSNTFVQWVIDQVPECGLDLPSNAWGKNYKKK